MSLLIIDDMLFEPYSLGGYQCKINTSKGIISIRCKSSLLFIDEDRPYEVWYPCKDVPTGYQTANDIYNYINNNAKL